MKKMDLSGFKKSIAAERKKMSEVKKIDAYFPITAKNRNDAHTQVDVIVDGLKKNHDYSGNSYVKSHIDLIEIDLRKTADEYPQ